MVGGWGVGVKKNKTYIHAYTHIFYIDTYTYRPLPVGQDAGPGDGEAVVLHAQRLHQGHVLLVPASV